MMALNKLKGMLVSTMRTETRRACPLLAGSVKFWSTQKFQALYISIHDHN